MNINQLDNYNLYEIVGTSKRVNINKLDSNGYNVYMGNNYLYKDTLTINLINLMLRVLFITSFIIVISFISFIISKVVLTIKYSLVSMDTFTLNICLFIGFILFILFNKLTYISIFNVLMVYLLQVFISLLICIRKAYK